MSTMMILVDTDDGFDARFRKKLEEEIIDDKYNIRRIVPDTTLTSQELVKKCVREVNQLVQDNVVACFFVDIVIFEKGALDTVGLDIARQLHVTFPDIPIFSITSKLYHEEMYDPYYDVFSEATLEDVDGVFAKSYLEGKQFSAKRLRQMFEKVKHKRSLHKPSESSKNDEVSLSKNAEKIKPSFNAETLDDFTSALISDIGSNRFWCLLGNLLPNAEGIIKAITPGRSGAYVFKVTIKFREKSQSPTRPKGWIIKVCTDKELIFEEAKNCVELIRTPVPRSATPRLLYPEPKGESGLWGIVYEYEGEADIMLQVLRSTVALSRCNMIAKNLIAALSYMYGDSYSQIKKIWKDYYSLKKARTHILSFINEYRQVFYGMSDSVKLVEDFVRTDGEILHDYSCEADTRHIHGDFNCGNILISPDNDVILIDFASRKQDHVAKDIAKLERDLLFRVADAYTPAYFTWDSFQLPDTLSQDFQFSSIKEEELCQGNYIIYLVSLLRKGLKEISPNIQEKEYLCALLHYCLLGIAHPSISIQRKALCIQYASKIIIKVGGVS